MSVSVVDLLTQLEAQGIELWTEGGGLRFRAPKGALTPELRASLAEQRDAVIAAVQERAQQSFQALPVSYNQLGMWLVHQVAPNNAAYNVSFSVRIRSAVDIDALHRAFQALVDRHSTLRTTFALEGDKPLQHIHGYREVDFDQVDLPDADEDQLYTQVMDSYQQPFDLETGSVMRVRLFTRGPEDHVLLTVIHHIAIDGWSLWILWDEFSKLYEAYHEGKSASLPYPEHQYSDFANWQTDMIASPKGEQLWTYWQGRLAGEITPIDLPTDHPRPQFVSYQGGTEWFELDETITSGLKALAKAEGATTYMVLLAALHIVLHRYTNQDEIVIGSPTLGRSRPEDANIVGDFVNMLPMRMNLDGDPTFSEYLAYVRQIVLGALEHQDFPFPVMVERLGTRTHMNRSPVFQVMFDAQRVRRFESLTSLLSQFTLPGEPVNRSQLSGLEIEAYPLPQQEGQFDLAMQVMDTDVNMQGVLKYSSDIYEGSTVARMLGHFKQVLDAVMVNPAQRISELPLLTESEQQEYLYDWNKTEVDYPADTGVHMLFEEQAALHPDVIAAVHNDQSITYGELNTRANQLAHYLQTLEIVPETTVGVHADRGIDMLVALLGILKAGGAYVPMDPAFPRERLMYMIEDAAMPIIISQAHLVDQLPNHAAKIIRIDSDWETIRQSPSANPPHQPCGDNLAYLIFTSGSTGRPKGVQIEHHSLTNFLLTMRDRPGLNADDVMLAITTLSFDIAALELYLPLIVGARVVLLDREASWDGRQIATALEEHQVTVMQATPASWQLLLESGWQGKRDLKILCGGEALPSALAERLLQASGELWNVYGPTETTIWSTVEQIVSTDETITIGRPIANTTVFVLDKHLQPVPLGVAGALYIGGVGVARGYIGRPDLTEERFIDNPFGGGSIYNTGDLARWLPDGKLECLGRVDHQVKVRGFRIELGEIEAALETHTSVQKAVVVAREDQPGDKRLVAYVIAEGEDSPETSLLRDYLGTKLPGYMVPSNVVMLDAFPLTPNGKVDRRALPAPVVTTERKPETAQEAKTPAETLMVNVWQTVLGVEKVSIYDNFFDLGGHSLQVVQVINQLEKETGIHLEPALMRYQSLRQQAAAIESSEVFQNMPTAAPQTIRLPGRLEVPIFFGNEDELYGMYYPAEALDQGDVGVVICNPWGPEYLRAHRACHQLALRLSNSGVPVLRFDYYGTGDSAGDDLEVSVKHSLADISTAISELQQRSGMDKVILVGVRLGATYAALASAQLKNIERLVLWEPLVNGSDYLEELQTWHRRNLYSYLSKVTQNTAETELMGFALSRQFVSDIEAINLLAIESKLADQALIVERETSDSTRYFCERLEVQQTATMYQQIDGPQLWTENVDKALVPHQTLEAIVDWIKKA